MSLAYWCVLCAGILPILTIGFAKAGREYDNSNPRSWLAQQSGIRQRADHAHRNHFEAFPFFAAAVLIATSVHAPEPVLDRLAVAFILIRVAYTAAYLGDKPFLRSTLWTLGYGCTVAIFVFAAARA